MRQYISELAYGSRYPTADGFVFTIGMAKPLEMFTLQYIYVIDALFAGIACIRLKSFAFVAKTYGLYKQTTNHKGVLIRNVIYMYIFRY